MLCFLIITVLFLDFFKRFSSFNISVINDSSPLIFSTCFSILICHLGFAYKILCLRCFGILPTLSDITKPVAYSSWLISLNDFPSMLFSNTELLSLINAFNFLVRSSLGKGGLFLYRYGQDLHTY